MFAQSVRYNRGRMIYFLTGENWYGRNLALKTLLKKVDVESVERPDISKMEVSELHDMLQAQSLFSEKRCIVLSGVSENKLVWEALGDVADAVSPDVALIIIEDKPDKRTKAYKSLQKHAEASQFPLWTPRDTPMATEWLLATAKAQDVPLKTRDAKQLIERVGVDQARLAAALEKLQLMSEITPESIEASIDRQPSDNVFALLETALGSDDALLRLSIESLRRTEDAYRVFGLLSSQLLQLAALVYQKDVSPGDVAKQIGAPPFVLTKLRPFAQRLSEREMAAILALAAATDVKMKSVAIDPWLLVEELLVKIARR